VISKFFKSKADVKHEAFVELLAQKCGEQEFYSQDQLDAVMAEVEISPKVAYLFYQNYMAPADFEALSDAVKTGKKHGGQAALTLEMMGGIGVDEYGRPAGVLADEK